MDATARHSKRIAGQGWLSTLLGVFVLVAGGFALGLVVGVISEEPELVVGHVSGRTTEVEWSAGEDGGGVAAAMPPDWPTIERSAARDDTGIGSAVERALPPVAAPRESKPSPDVARASSPIPASGTPPRRASDEVAVPQVAAKADGTSRFAIQVGAFQAAKAAQGVAEGLRANGYPVQVLAPQSDDRWRVRVGPIATRTEADETAQRLKVEENLPTWVLREGGP